MQENCFVTLHKKDSPSLPNIAIFTDQWGYPQLEDLKGDEPINVGQ